jgi:hypothetical protein
MRQTTKDGLAEAELPHMCGIVIPISTVAANGTTCDLTRNA